MTVTEAVDLTILRVDGRLTGTGVTELDGACRRVGRPLVLDLTNLMGGTTPGSCCSGAWLPRASTC